MFRYFRNLLATDGRRLCRLFVLCFSFVLGSYAGTWALKNALLLAATATSCTGDAILFSICAQNGGVGPCCQGGTCCWYVDSNGDPAGCAYTPSCPMGTSAYSTCSNALGTASGSGECVIGCRNSDGSCIGGSGGGGSGCTGNCTWEWSGSNWGSTGSTCSSGCTCSAPTTAGTMMFQTETTSCGSGTITCSGSATWTAVCNAGVLSWSQTTACGTGCSASCPSAAPSAAGATTTTTCASASNATVCGTGSCACAGQCQYSAASDGQGGYVWTLSSSSCTASVSGCTCPSSPGGNCPSGPGDTTSAACGSSGGACKPVACSGSCYYIATGGGTCGYVWTLQRNGCTVGADNCGCPSTLGGNCPTASGQTTTSGCGAAGGTCTCTCTGTCNYTSVADPVLTGQFKWQLGTNNCSGGSQCSCPACPSAVKPGSAGLMTTAACGSPSEACACPVSCANQGGDADNDCCCADVDCNDNDPTVCLCDNCTGTCTRCWAPDPQGSYGLGAPPTWSIEGVTTVTQGYRSGAPMIECDPNDPNGPAGCSCATISNGDMDGDGCCDCRDDYPTDPRQGCACCNMGRFWVRGGGLAFHTAWKQVFPFGGPAAQFLTWSRGSSGSPGYWSYAGPVGDPGSLALTLPFNAATQGFVYDIPVTVPLSLVQLETVMTSVTGVSWTGVFASLDSLRAAFRTALVFVVAAMCLGVVFQEVRV